MSARTHHRTNRLSYRSCVQKTAWIGAIFLGGVLPCKAQTGAVPSENILQYSARTEVLDHRVTGPGRESSFNLPGTWLLHEGDFRRALRLESGWYSDLNLNYRLTNSTQFDPDKLSLQKFEWRLSDQDKLFTAGDYYANFSQYSLSKAIKGLAFQRNFRDEQNYVRAAYGSFDGRWAYLHRKNNEDEPMDRHGGGLRVQRSFDKYRFGLNLSHVTDRDDDPRRKIGQDAFQQSIGAFDWEYREPGLLIEGEHAYANSEIMPFGAASRDAGGSANKIVFRGTLKDISIDANLERVSPGFMTLGGGATPDRVRGYFRGDATVARLWKVFGLVDHSRNNLNGALTGTTYNTTYEGGLTRRRAFDRRTLTLSGSLRQRITDTSQGTGNRVANRVKLRANDRFFGVVDFRGFIETSIDRNKSAVPGTRALDTLFGLALNSRHELTNKWIVQPEFEISRQETQNIAAGGSDVYDVLRLGLRGDGAAGAQAGVNYEYNTATVVAPFGNSRRNRFNAFWQTKPDWLRFGWLRFELNDSINNFADSSRNFKERLLKATLQIDFERRSEGGAR